MSGSKEREIGMLYEAMSRIRSTINDNSSTIRSLFSQREGEEIERIAAIATATIRRLLTMSDTP